MSAPPGISDTDDRLVELIEAGDLQGLGCLYDRHGAECLRAAVGCMDDRADTEDLVFEVFLMIWRDPPPVGVSMRQFLLACTLKKAQHFRGIAPPSCQP
jgi:DNA-directed RNA polymerase specialized sigma24 family protein